MAPAAANAGGAAVLELTAREIAVKKPCQREAGVNSVLAQSLSSSSRCRLLAARSGWVTMKSCALKWQKASKLNCDMRG